MMLPRPDSPFHRATDFLVDAIITPIVCRAKPYTRLPVSQPMMTTDKRYEIRKKASGIFQTGGEIGMPLNSFDSRS